MPGTRSGAVAAPRRDRDPRVSPSPCTPTGSGLWEELAQLLLTERLVPDAGLPYRPSRQRHVPEHGSGSSDGSVGLSLAAGRPRRPTATAALHVRTHWACRPRAHGHLSLKTRSQSRVIGKQSFFRGVPRAPTETSYRVGNALRDPVTPGGSALRHSSPRVAGKPAAGRRRPDSSVSASVCPGGGKEGRSHSHRGRERPGSTLGTGSVPA